MKEWKFNYIKGKPEHSFNKEIIEFIKIYCKPINSSIEIGAGTGQMSKLLKQEYDCNITTVDSSESSMQYQKQYFKDSGITGNIIKANIFELDKQEYEMKYDMVMSFGLIEHFQGEELKNICRIHKDFSKLFIAVVVPNATKKEIEFAKTKECKDRYGYQRTFKDTELNQCMMDGEWEMLYNAEFYTDNKLRIGIFRKVLIY